MTVSCTALVVAGMLSGILSGTEASKVVKSYFISLLTFGC